MIKVFEIISNTRYWAEEKGTALTETAILIPVFISLLMGVYDLGQGIVVNQKSITASQVVADLITRNREIDMDTLSDIVRAGRMALDPYDTTDYGYDIASVLYDEDGDPVIQWRVTDNMLPNDDAINNVVETLGLVNQGLVVVTTEYGYVPYFSEFVTDEIEMREVAFLRGRGSSLIRCDDCPGGP